MKGEQKIAHIRLLLALKGNQFTNFKKAIKELQKEAEAEEERLYKEDVKKIFKAAIDHNKKKETAYLLGLKVAGAEIKTKLYNKDLNTNLPTLCYLISLQKKELFKDLIKSGEGITAISRKRALRFAKEKEVKNKFYIDLLKEKKEKEEEVVVSQFKWVYLYGAATLLLVLAEVFTIYFFVFLSEAEKDEQIVKKKLAKKPTISV